MFALATETLAGWEVLPADPRWPPSPGASATGRAGAQDRHAVAPADRSLEPHLVAMALTALADLRAGQFVVIRISARAITGDPVRRRLSETARLDGLALIIIGRMHEDGLRIVESARKRGALVGRDATDTHGDSGRVPAFKPDLLSLALSGAWEPGHDPAPGVSAMVRLARELGAKTLMHGIDNRDDAARFHESGVTLGQGPAMGPPQRQTPASGDRAGRIVPSGDPSASAGAPSSLSPTSELQTLAERAPCVQVWEPLSAIVDLSLGDAEHDWLVIVDASGRPVALVERAALLRGEPFERRVEVVGTTMPLRTAAQTALARPRVDRSRPLALCDADDRYLGLLRLERLLEALAA